MARQPATSDFQGTAERRRRALLACGILAPILYVAMTLFVGLHWEGYSIVSNVPSELSAIGAPTRQLWIWLGAVYGVLMVAFGWIVWRAAPPNRALGIVGALLIAHTIFGQLWPPMHQREVLAAGGGTLTDTLHLVWAAITGVFFMFIVGFGAAALGKRFRAYSIATIVIVLACGAVTATYASRVQADLPTPGVGAWERISIAAFMAWIVVLAIALTRGNFGNRSDVKEVVMQTSPQVTIDNPQLDRRLNDVGWGLVLMLTGVIWLLPPAAVPSGTWLLGIAVILIGLNIVRYLNHMRVNGFSVVVGMAALVAAISQLWRSDPPLVAIFLLVIGASLVARPLFTRTA